MSNNTVVEWQELQKKQVCVTKRLTEVSQDLEVELCVKYPQYRVLKQLVEDLNNQKARSRPRGDRFDYDWCSAFSTAIGVVQQRMSKCKEEILEAEMALVENES